MSPRIVLTAVLASLWSCAGPSPESPSLRPSEGGAAAAEPGPPAPQPREPAPAESPEARAPAQAEAQAEPAPRARIGPPSPEYLTAARLHAQASAALREGDPERAEALIDQALEAQPHYRPAVAAKAALCREAGRPSEAIEALDRALVARPEDGYLLSLKAEALYEAGEPAEAMESLLRVVSQGDDVPAVRLLRARILADGGDEAGALAAIEDALKHGFHDLDRLETDPSFELLRSEREFRTMLDTAREERRLARESALLPEPPSTVVRERPEATELPTLHELRSKLRDAIASGAGRAISLDAVGVDGDRVRISDSLGRVVVVELWGTWSRLSTIELEHVERLHEAVAHLGVDAVALCREVYHDPSLPRERVEVDVRAYRRDFGLALPCAVIDERTARELGVTKYPTTIFVGRDGKAYLQATGYKDYEVLAELVHTLLEDGPPPPEPDYPPSEEGSPEEPPAGASGSDAGS